MEVGNEWQVADELQLQPNRQSIFIVGTRVDCSDYERVTNQVVEWATNDRGSRYVCVCTVHMVMEGYDDKAYQAIVNRADLTVSDGMPLVWCLKCLGFRDAQRVYGPELTPRLCKKLAERGVSVGFYGGTDSLLAKLRGKLTVDYPGLRIDYMHAPPFRALTEAEVELTIREIGHSGVKVLFVGLGCPKQERWMADVEGRLPVVMLGVGAAFDFLAGLKAQAPKWMQSAGLEWLFRLITEPRRLWLRYLKHNPRFVWLAGKQLVNARLGRRITS